MATTIVQTRTAIPAELKNVRPSGSYYTFDELYRFAQMCHASGLFEDVADAAQAMIKIVKGQELGLPPTTAMSGFDLIKKRLFIKPWIIAAQINACGYGSYRVVSQTPEVCTITFTRKYAGSGWKECPAVSYTFAEAKAHGLVDRSPHWKASPAHMLYQRCMGRGGAMYFPELLAGLAPPPDDMPIAPERHQQNIIDLFGDDARGSTAAPLDVNLETGEIQDDDDNAPGGVREPRTPPVPTPETSGKDNASTATPAGKTSAMLPNAWRDTLEAHKDNQALGRDLQAKVRLALKPGSETTDAKGFELASAVLDTLDNIVA